MRPVKQFEAQCRRSPDLSFLIAGTVLQFACQGFRSLIFPVSSRVHQPLQPNGCDFAPPVRAVDVSSNLRGLSASKSRSRQRRVRLCHKCAIDYPLDQHAVCVPIRDDAAGV